MLGTYIDAKFAIPENPVMRAVAGAPILLTAPEKKGVTGFSGLGCGCNSKIPSFGLGNAGDLGLKLYGDWYGAQQHGGMVLNGDPNGLGTYFPSNAHGYRGFSGLGDVGTFISNLTSGNFADALTTDDLIGGIPNWVTVPVILWLLFSIVGDTKRTYRKVSGGIKRSRKASIKKKKKKALANKMLKEADLGIFDIDLAEKP